MIEAACGAVFGVVVPFLALFALDRLGDSAGWLRGTLFALAVAGCATIPWALHRWVWRNRRLEQLARLLSRKHPHVGDQLLGVIELVENDAEQARSRTLCEAAIEQVAGDARKRDFRDAVPNPRHRLWSVLAAVPAIVALGLGVLYPAAAANAWARLLAPWHDIPRYTFAAFEPLPEQVVVAHGEPFSFTARLTANSLSHPSQGTVQLGGQQPVTVSLRNGRYEFELPSQIDAGQLDMRIGDFRQSVRVEPKLRPELTSITAEFALPDYLGLPEKQTKDVRGGALSLVNGSRVELIATASLACTHAEKDAAAAFFTPKAATIEGSARVLAAALESASACAELRAKGTPAVTTALRRSARP
jgi:hypothetical protein